MKYLALCLTLLFAYVSAKEKTKVHAKPLRRRLIECTAEQVKLEWEGSTDWGDEVLVTLKTAGGGTLLDISTTCQGYGFTCVPADADDGVDLCLDVTTADFPLQFEGGDTSSDSWDGFSMKLTYQGNEKDFTVPNGYGDYNRLEDTFGPFAAGGCATGEFKYTGTQDPALTDTCISQCPLVSGDPTKRHGRAGTNEAEPCTGAVVCATEGWLTHDDVCVESCPEGFGANVWVENTDLPVGKKCVGASRSSINSLFTIQQSLSTEQASGEAFVTVEEHLDSYHGMYRYGYSSDDCSSYEDIDNYNADKLYFSFRKLSDNKCVRVSCPEGEVLNSSGECYAPCADPAATYGPFRTIDPNKGYNEYTSGPYQVDQCTITSCAAVGIDATDCSALKNAYQSQSCCN